MAKTNPYGLKQMPRAHIKNPGAGYGAPGILRPHTWATGTDPIKHEMHHAFLASKAQASFRNEPWTLTRDEYIELWSQGNDWSNRGRGRDNVCMTRIDAEGAWCRDNVMIVSRYEQIFARTQKRIGSTYNKGPKP
jgi:hypothetical protein